MKLSELIEIGKLGNKVTEEGFFLFKWIGEPKEKKFTFRDVFLFFTDYRVRYVTIENVDYKRDIFLKIKEKYLIEDIIKDGKVKVLLAPEDYTDYMSKSELLLYFHYKAITQSELFGVVVDYIEKPFQNIFVVKRSDNGRELLIPDVNRYVEKLDDKEHIVYFNDIDELKNL